MNYAASAHPDITAELPGWRATALFVVLLFGLFGLFGRGVYLQGIRNDFLQEKGNARYSRVIEVSAHRGMITDRNGEPLAVSTPVESVWVSPADVEADSRQVKQLAQILGFTGQDDNGQEGLELALQERLAGKSGSQRVIKDRRGHIVEDAGSLHAPKPGSDIALSLDSKVQHLAYRELVDAVKQHKAKAGAVVVLDAKSGEVLALANYPAYNPNNRSKVGSQAMRNRAIADLFEPGSTMKPFTVATAIEQGKVRPETVINTENGVYTVGNRKIHDSHPESMLTVAQVIQKSSNVGAAKIALSMESETLWQSLADSGFGAQTGSNFP